MKSVTVKSGGSDKLYYYHCTKRSSGGPGTCSHRKHHRAERLEPLVWGFVSGLLKDPERLRAGLDRMIERKRAERHGDPQREAKMWADKLTEVEAKRARFQDMAAEGLISFDELGTKLAALQEARKVAERELRALEAQREELAELERDRDAFLGRYAEMVPDDLDALAPEERHRVYKLLKLRAKLQEDGTPEVSGILGDYPGICKVETLST